MILDTVFLVNGEASYTWNNVSYGTYNLTAEYSGDSNYENAAESINGYDVQKRTQDALTITGAPTSIVYGDESFTLGTTGGNGSGAVKYTVQSGDAVSISGDTVTIEKAGTTIIKVTKEADDTYNETSSTITLNVDKATPTIQENPSVNGANVGKALSDVSLSKLIANGVDGSALSGSFAWQNPQTVIQGSGKHTAIFTPTDAANYNSVTFEVQVNLDTTKPVITSLKTTIPRTGGTGNISLWIGLMLLGTAGIIGTTVWRKKCEPSSKKKTN